MLAAFLDSTMAAAIAGEVPAAAKSRRHTSSDSRAADWLCHSGPSLAVSAVSCSTLRALHDGTQDNARQLR